MDGYSYQSIVRHLYDPVLSEEVLIKDHLLFIEISVTNEEIIEELLEDIPEFSDSLISTNDKEFRNIWRMR